MLDAVANAIWHVFNFLDDKSTGLVVKSRLKVLTANLGTILNSYNVERGLDDFRSTPHLSFEHFKYYLSMELFSSLPSTLDLGTRMEYQHQIEELCWLISKQSLLKRDRPVFSQQSVFQMFRIFCCLSEEISDQRVGITFAMHVDELKRISEAFVNSVGRKFDVEEFGRVTQNTEFFTFPLMLEFIERRYGANVEEGGAKEAVQELYDTYALDVLRKGHLSKKGELFPTFREYWFVLKPFCLTYFSNSDEKDKKGEIALNATLRVETPSGPAVGDHGGNIGSTSSLTMSAGSLGSMDKVGTSSEKLDNKPAPQSSSTKQSHKFSIKSPERNCDFIASDHRSKLQWIAALKLAFDSCDLLQSYQRSLANRRRRDREVSKRKECEERQRRASQIDIMEKTKAQLFAEKLAREAAEAEAKSLAKERELDEKRLRALEGIKEQLEKTLEEETQARRDEEIVRNLQARVLREEWEKRDQLELLHEEQKRLLEEEKEKRRQFEMVQREKESKLAAIEKRLKELEEDRRKLDKELRVARIKVSSSEQNKEILEARLRARDQHSAGKAPLQRQKSQNEHKKKRALKNAETGINAADKSDTEN